MDKFTVTSKINSLMFLDGYSCESKDINNFVSHLVYKFKNRCSEEKIRNAFDSGEIVVHGFVSGTTGLGPTKITTNKKLNIVNEYLGSYGYILEINHGTVEYPIIERKSFVDDVDAREWIKSNSQN